MRRSLVLRSALLGKGSRSPPPPEAAAAEAGVGAGAADCSEAVEGAGVEARVVSELGAGEPSADDSVSSLSRSSSMLRESEERQGEPVTAAAQESERPAAHRPQFNTTAYCRSGLTPLQRHNGTASGEETSPKKSLIL